MSYVLEFTETALKEWRRLDNSVRLLLRKQLAARLKDPHVPSARLAGSQTRYRIKLRAIGYRLAYEVIDRRLVVPVIAVGQRGDVYADLHRR